MRQSLLLIPYILVTLGVVSDYITTQLGLSSLLAENTFHETHLVYAPLTAAFIFFGAMVIMQIILGDFKHKTLYMSIIACFSFEGAINNILVMLGVFGGLII